MYSASAVCVAGFVLLANISGTHCLNEACTKNSDCATEDSICKDQQCVCSSLYYFNGTKCLPFATEFKANCEETAQCVWLGEKAECRNNYCLCETNYRWFQGKCQPYVGKGEKCSIDTDCYDNHDLLALSCISKICSCTQGYYDRGLDCRVSSTTDSPECALDIDCSGLGDETNTYNCTVGKCVLASSGNSTEEFQLDDIFSAWYKKDSNVKVKDDAITCEFNEDCRDMANSVCDMETGTCQCRSETEYLLEGNCVIGFKECSTEEDCAKNPNSMCYLDTCICKQGYFLSDGACIPELGYLDASLQDITSCSIRPAKYANQACYCRNFWFTDDSNRNCIKTMIQHIGTCLTSEWCEAMGPYSYCESESNSCKCSSYAKLNESNYYCELQQQPNSTNCLHDTDCKINEICTDEICQCETDFSRNEDNICLPNIGGSCETASCSHIDNAGCAGDVCKCHTNSIGKLNRCLKVADHLNDSCEEDEQCQNLDHATCGFYSATAVNKTCICAEEYVEYEEEGICLKNKKYGDPCMKSTDCTLVLNRTFQCRNSICQCPVEYKLHNGYCTRSGSVKLSWQKWTLAFSVILIFRLGIL